MVADYLPQDTIIVSASRIESSQDQTPASTSVVDSQSIERLGLPLAEQFIRLTPSAAVAVSGPSGSLTDVRIRGAEANHTLLFIDGIRANDPAAGDLPRFELLNADLADRIEVVRGPQSALWGPDALGGVVAVDGGSQKGFGALLEGGSFGSRRARLSGGIENGALKIVAAGAIQQADGINAIAGPGDEDGYRNIGGRVRATYCLGSATIGASGFVIAARSQYDGYHPVTFDRADTFDNSRQQLGAGRLWGEVGEANDRLSGALSASLLKSTNRNAVDDAPINRTRASRTSISGQMAWRMSDVDTLVAAIEGDREKFAARDTAYGGFSNQDQRRNHWGATLEYKRESGALVTALAIRHDIFDRFKDSTTVRAGAVLSIGKGWAVAGSLATGMAPPTFFDLYGFFPGNFIGNPGLEPETSSGGEISLRYTSGRWAASLTGYTQRLRNEIIDVFDVTTFTSTTINSNQNSRRKGLEVVVAFAPSPRFRLGANGALLRAQQPSVGGDYEVELRRPKVSGAVTADGKLGRLTYGAALAFTGKHRDRRDSFPYDIVALAPYALVSAKLGYSVTSKFDVFARVSNALASKAEDLAGYRSEGRGVYAGIAVRP